MTAIDGVFCMCRACDKQTRGVSTVTLDWSEIMFGCNTADSVVRDRRTKWVGHEISKQTETAQRMFLFSE